MSVKNIIKVTNAGISPVLSITQGTDAVEFEFTIADYNIPSGSSAVAYNIQPTGNIVNQPCSIAGNIIKITPRAYFFLRGKNYMQFQITNNKKNLFSFLIEAWCSPNISEPEVSEVQDPTVVTQVLSKLGEIDLKIDSVDTRLGNRINNIVANNNPTEGNTELIDIRSGYDGTTYPSAGEAVRKQIGSLSEDIDAANNFKVISRQSYKSKDNIDYTSKLSVSNFNFLNIPIDTTGTIQKINVGVTGSGKIVIAIISAENLSNYQPCTIVSQNEFDVSDGENSIECSIDVETGQYVAFKTETGVELNYINSDSGFSPTYSVNYTDYYYILSGASATRFYDISWEIYTDSKVKKYVDEEIQKIKSELGITNNQWNGKTCITFGNSITYGNTWQPYLKELLGFSEMWNRGASSSTMSNIGPEKMVVYTDTSKYNEDRSSWLYKSPYSGDGEDIPEGTEVQNYWMFDDDRINKLPRGKDLLLIMCGTNDFFRSFNFESDEKNDIIGDTNFTAYWNPQNIYDNSTIIGALCTCIKKIKETMPETKIVVVGMPFNNGVRTKKSGQYFFEVLDGIEKGARSMGVKYIDLVSLLGWNNINIISKCSDGVHPDSESGKEIAIAIASEIKNIY